MTHSRLSPEDRVVLRGDRDPRRRTTVGGVAVLDGRADWDLVRERLDRASRTVPALRQRAVEPTLTTTEPRWVIDPDFHLDQHVRRVALPQGAGRDGLIDLVEALVEAPFDPSGPLWSVTVVDGVRVGRKAGSAIVTAMSPLLKHGREPLDLLDLVLDGRDDGAPLPAVPVPTDLEPVDLAKAGLRELPSRAAGLALGGVQEVAALAMRGVSDPHGLSEALGISAPTSDGPGSPLLAGRGTARRLLTLSYPLARVATARGARGSEPVHLAAIRAAMHHYHQALGLPRPSLDLTSAAHPTTMRRALAPVQDPVDTYGRLLPLLPDGVLDAIARPARAADIAVSHVTSTVGGSVGPARVTERYAVGPVPGNALTSVAVATQDEVFVAVRYDTEAIREPQVLEQCLAEAFDEVLGAASPAPAPAPAPAPGPAPAKAAKAAAKAAKPARTRGRKRA